MGLLDTIKSRLPTRSKVPIPFSPAGIEGKTNGEVLAGERAGYGGVPTSEGRAPPALGKLSSRQFEADSTVPKIVRGFEVFFPFVNLCILVGQASFQRRWGVGISARVVVSLLSCLQGLLYSGFVLASFLLADTLRFLRGPERFFKQIRSSIVLDSSQVALNLLLAIVTTASASSAGCKDPSKDPHADKEGYTDALPSFCRNKRASAAFFWLAFFACSATLAFCLVTFARVRRAPTSSAFVPPTGVAAPGGHFPQDADDATWTGRPSYDAVPARGSGSATAPAGYRPGHAFSNDGERLFAGHAPGYGVRDPFEDPEQSDGDGRGNVAYQAIPDPYEAIRQSMERPAQQRY
ncbi:hypothetical protein BMF94_7028 [Rhodotorula taiwanensis]|uniref:MARVEL domain-containing protein n=1 Tax=Rhodotorula taiwanensis TaxID=741276 RepID=A0A2S5AZN0_9BASI|nr:hypothetical protein BMF94_7028 [Rhodotorula taiwanensis]